MRTTEPVVAELLADYRTSAANLRSMETSLARQLGSNRNRVDEAAVERFGELIRAKMIGGDPAMRKAYVRLLVSRVTVSDQQILIKGSKAALGAAVTAPDESQVISFDREWCGTQSGANRSLPGFKILFPLLGCPRGPCAIRAVEFTVRGRALNPRL